MIKKFFLVVFIIIMVMNIGIDNTVKAESISGVFGSGDDFVNLGKEDSKLDDNFTNASNFIYTILYSISIVIAVIAGIILGIKYMTSSVEGKAEVKQSLIVYFVALAIIFGAYGIWKTIIEILN